MLRAIRQVADSHHWLSLPMSVSYFLRTLGGQMLNIKGKYKYSSWQLAITCLQQSTIGTQEFGCMLNIASKILKGQRTGKPIRQMWVMETLWWNSFNVGYVFIPVKIVTWPMFLCKSCVCRLCWKDWKTSAKLFSCWSKTGRTTRICSPSLYELHNFRYHVARILDSAKVSE